MPEEDSCIMRVLADYLKASYSMTSLSGTQVTHPQGLQYPHGDAEGNERRDVYRVRSPDGVRRRTLAWWEVFASNLEVVKRYFFRAPK